ncbi:MAG: NAD(P)/FAD-dependent oxidoreductase [Prochloraceae cyanobacterium]
MNKEVISGSGSQEQAIVIGGGIAGILAARVLSDHFERVTIIERDRYPQEPKPRPGVPQSYQVHGLLSQGEKILEQLFPGLKASLTKKGAIKVDWVADNAWLLGSTWSPNFASEITSYACSRNLLELTIRKHLENFSQVNFLDAALVTDLLTNSNKTDVEGVRVKVNQEREIELAAQLVVDASGRNSFAPKWLKALGYEIPTETRINSFLGYAARSYQRPKMEAQDWQFLYIMPSAPDNPRGGIISALEDDRWMVTLIGIGKDYPPTEENGFLDFARSLRS